MTTGLVTRAAEASHYNAQPMINVYASVTGRDLGAVADDVAAQIKAIEPELPRGATIVMRGQVETMRSSFQGLALGLLGAIVLAYLLIVVNFQSWLDPFIIITALPGALAGIVWTLLLTHTTMSVPSLTGAIMCMGVATANSILVVSFARERMHHGADARTAALEAGVVRMRPVLMTALAMTIGMIPMAIGLGEGGEQNAPLGRAVAGGLVAATVATLFFVPVVFELVHGRGRRRVTPAEIDRGLMTAERKVGGGRIVLAVVGGRRRARASPRRSRWLGAAPEFRALERETEAQGVTTVAVIHPDRPGR